MLSYLQESFNIPLDIIGYAFIIVGFIYLFNLGYQFFRSKYSLDSQKQVIAKSHAEPEIRYFHNHSISMFWSLLLVFCISYFFLVGTTTLKADTVSKNVPEYSLSSNTKQLGLSKTILSTTLFVKKPNVGKEITYLGKDKNDLLIFRFEKNKFHIPSEYVTFDSNIKKPMIYGTEYSGKKNTDMKDLTFFKFKNVVVNSESKHLKYNGKIVSQSFTDYFENIPHEKSKPKNHW